MRAEQLQAQYKECRCICCAGEVQVRGCGEEDGERMEEGVEVNKELLAYCVWGVVVVFGSVTIFILLIKWWLDQVLGL